VGKEHYEFQNLKTLMNKFCRSNNDSSQMHAAIILILFSSCRKEDKAPTMCQKYFQFCSATIIWSLLRGIIRNEDEMVNEE
jgi:hypothetical protein